MLFGCERLQEESPPQQQQKHRKSTGMFALPFVSSTTSSSWSSSLGLLLRVPLLLQPLHVALGHGVDDGNDEVADHEQHHLLKHPRQPVLVLEEEEEESGVDVSA